MTPTILVAEDDRDVATMVAYGARLIWPGCRVHVAPDGAEALRHVAEGPPDLVVLDVQMPPPDGFEVCRRIREASAVPILMLTVRTSTLDKVHAFDVGADGYLTKPFDHLELLARLRALLRRGRGAGAPASLAVGGLTLDAATREARVGGRAIRLTPTEYRLLEKLARHAGHVFPHHYLLRQVWGPEYVGEVHYLRVFVRRLRRKLGDDADHPHHIQTEWNSGYRFAP
jgi:two-component system KDP operon response regulator KdpE